MVTTGRVIQIVVLFSTVLGAAFLLEANGLVQTEVWGFVAMGWVLFLVDSVLTFVRPEVSYYLAFVLAVLALAASLPQPAHHAFITEGLFVPAAIFITGSIAQVSLLILVPLHLLRRGKSSNGSVVEASGSHQM